MHLLDAYVVTRAWPFRYIEAPVQRAARVVDGDVGSRKTADLVSTGAWTSGEVLGCST